MTWLQEKETLARDILVQLYKNRMIRTFYRDRAEGWTLVSGIYSPLYIQLRPLASYPEAFRTVSQALARMLEEEAPHIRRVIGIAMAGIPLAAGVAITKNIPAGFTRKMERVTSVEKFRASIVAYGEHNLVEGELASGDNIALVDDLVTGFDSKLVAFEQVRYEAARRGLQDVHCSTVVVVLDREQGGQDAAHRAGITLHCLIPFKTFGLHLLRDVMHPKEWDIIAKYLEEPYSFQDQAVQEELRRLAGKSANSSFEP